MSIKIVHSGDAHIDSSVHNVGLDKATRLPRAWVSHRKAFRSVCDAAIQNQADALVLAGDGFADGNPTQEAILAYAEALIPVAKAGVPIVLIDGNHERIRVRTAYRTATTTVGAILAEHGEVHIVEREPRLIRLDSGIQVASLPWLSKSTVLAQMGEENIGAVEGDRKVVQYALDALESMCGQADATAPLIMASHVTVDDVRLDSIAKGHKRGSEVEMAHLFAEPILPRQTLEDSPISYAALSHIHARQRMGQKCFYAGAPDRFTLADADDPKSANLVTIDDDNTLVSVDYIDTASRKMHSIDLTTNDAEDRLESLEPEALVGLILPAGKSTIPDSVAKTIADAGAFVIDTKSTPVDRPRQATVVVSEKADTATALSTWLTEKRPGVDQARILSLASELTEEEVSPA